MKRTVIQSRLTAISFRVAPWAIALSVALAACAVPTPTPPAPTTTAPVAELPQPTQSPGTTEATPLPAETTVPDGISFTADPTLAASPIPQMVPAIPAGPGPSFGGAAPAHWLITFAGQSQPEMFSPYIPQMRVLPVDGLAAIDPSIVKTIDELKALLASRPAEITGAVPLLPVLAAAQVMHAQTKYLDFPTGSGIRFVTHYAQDVSPVTSDRAFYTFQGLTGDGKYYITLFYPVRTDALPAKFEDVPGTQDMDAFVKSFDKYLVETVAMLNGLAPSAFSPDLSALDGMLQSLNIALSEPPAGAAAAPDSAPVSTATPSPEAQTWQAVTTAYVNVRSGPGTDNKIVGNVRRARYVDMLGRNEPSTWIKVRLTDGTDGWISAAYLKSSTPFANLPVAQP